MNLAAWPHGLAYLGVFLAAVLEGEVVFVGAAVLVRMGHLDAAGVLVAGAMGGATGDNFFFYALRGRLARWLERFPRLHRRQMAIAARVRAHSTVMVLLSRFLPGLRVAIPAACALGCISAPRFTVLNLVSAFAWASTIMVLVAYGGPAVLSWIGLKGWWGLIVPAAFVVVFFRWLARMSDVEKERRR